MKLHTTVVKKRLAEADRLNRAVYSSFLAHYQDEKVFRSHLFNQRYENIYLTEKHVPQLPDLLAQARHYASELCGTEQLRAGCWFNYMPPGAVTTRHNHDEADEVLSAVYYVRVPADSGDLILYDNEPASRITPQAGQLIFFPPHIDHEVTRNNSDEARLSIAINFGPRDEID